METSYTSLSTTSWTKTLSSQARITACSVSYTGGDTPQPTTYTVTFDAGEGTFAGNTDFPNASNTVVAGTYTLPSATPAEGYVFNGWALGENTYEGGANYTVSGNADFVASYTENTTPTPSGTTATLNIEAYADANNWVNGTKYATATVSPVTFTATGGGNTGKYYTSGEEWRFYQSENASITISVAEGYTLVSVIPTYNVSNNGVLKNGNSTIASGSTVAVSGTTVTFTVGNSGTATNGQVKFTNINVVYVSDGSTQTASDLTITNESTDLAFDLYNNTTAQVINYTTSSTGAITITPAESDYFSYVHDATAKTITVTPTAVTPSAQTVTISQAADDDYYAGTATFTVSVANSDPNIPGTENNPYTVAQARAAIDANAGTQGVYATGIVSAIPTAYNSTYGNVTFNMVDEAGDEVFLQAYRCGGDEAANVAVGDVAVVYGDLIKYGSTYEFGQGCTLVSLTHPVITEPTITVNPDVVDVDGLMHVVQLPITYHNIVVENYESFGVQFYDAEGEETETPDWLVVGVTGVMGGNDDDYVVTCAIPANQGEAHTTYLKVYAYDAEQNVVYSNLITISQAAPTYAELPFAFNGGKADIDETDGLYQESLDDYNASTNPTTKLKFDGTGDWLLLQFNERPGTLTFDIKNNSFSGGTFKVQTSENGVTFTDLKTYTEISGTQNEEFTNLGENVRYIKWIYTEKVSGNVGLGNIALAEYTEPQQYTLTVEPFENLDLITFVNDEMVLEGDGEITVTEGDEIMLSVVALEGYVMETLMVNGENHVDDIAEDYTYTFEMPAENVTISATAVEDVAPVGVTYSYTLANNIESGKQYIIVGWADGIPYAMGYQKSNNRHAVEISVDETTATAMIDNTETNVHEFTITSLGEGYYSIMDATTSGGYLYAASNNSNLLKTEAELDANHNGEWEITFDAESGSASVVASLSENRNVMQFNNSSKLFACYASASQHPVFLYEKVEYPLDIIGYEAGSDGGYYLIASPVTVNPANVQGMTTGNFDLYYFDESKASEWINYEGENGNFDLEPGKGYLYAKQATEPDEVFHFELSGTPYDGEPIELQKTAGAGWEGWNLVGNPYAVTAYIDRDFYVMNSDGSEIITGEGNEIAPMQGIFVIAGTIGEKLTFSTEAPTTTDGKIVMNVSDARRSVVDRAMVRFGEGRTLPKFMFNDENTKIYIPQYEDEYAVVRSDNDAELPVNFKAAENGTYTLSINAENVEMDYMHLIDNMTGTDIDLLSTPSYTFDARTTDYANRFKLVFATTTGVSENSENNFAFFNGDEWVVNNEGEATLQIVDVTGRVLSTETINGNARISLDQVSGVYMMRLVSGNNVKTQKVIIK